MFTLFDLMRDAQGGAFFDNLARRYGLSLEQSRRAVEAFMPAFSAGLRRSAADPGDFAALLRLLGGGSHSRLFEDPAAAFSDEALAEGEAFLTRAFGSRDIARAVTEQAAAVTGIGHDVLRAMLPAVAGVMMGGLARETQREAPDNPFLAMVRQMRRAATESGSPADMMAPFLPPFLASAWSTGEEARRDDEDLVARLFDAGRELQAGYSRQIEEIFDAMLEGLRSSPRDEPPEEG